MARHVVSVLGMVVVILAADLVVLALAAYLVAGIALAVLDAFGVTDAIGAGWTRARAWVGATWAPRLEGPRKAVQVPRATPPDRCSGVLTRPHEGPVHVQDAPFPARSKPVQVEV